MKDAAKAIAESTRDLKLERLVVAADRDLGTDFMEALPQELRERVVCVVPINLIDATAPDVAEHLDEHMRQAWRDRSTSLPTTRSSESRPETAVPAVRTRSWLR